MNWFTSFGLVLILAFVQPDYAEGRRGHHHSGGSSKSPWANPEKANVFMKCLIQKISNSPVFPQQEKEDMEEIVETMMSAFTSMSTSSGSNAAKLQAMNMAFASSMAELVIAEDADDPESISVKTEALAKALQQCFKSTMGSVNRHFIMEIKDLIGMFAREAAASDDNDAGGDEGPDFEAPSQTTVFTSDNNIYGGDYSGAQGMDFPGSIGSTVTSGGYPGGSLVQIGGSAPGGDISVKLSRPLTSTLASSNVFRAAYNPRVSTPIAINLTNTLIQKIASNLGLDYATASKLRSASMDAVSKVRMGSDTNTYAQAIANAIADVLSSSGKVADTNLNQIAPQLARGIVQGVSSAGPQFGIDLSGINVQGDLSNVARNIQTSIQSGPTQLNVGGLDSGTEYPGGLSVSMGMDGGAPSDVSAGGDVTSKLLQTLGSALLRSDIFKSIYKPGVSNQVAMIVTNSALQSAVSSLGLDAATASLLKSKISQALSTVNAGSDSTVYAKAIASTIAQVLGSSGQLNDGNVNQIGAKIATGILRGSSVIAPRLGIDLSGINVDSDIGGVTSFIMSGGAASPTTVNVGDADLSGGYSGGSLVQIEGSAPGADISVKLSQPLSSALASSNVFRAAYNPRISTPNAIKITKSLMQTIASNLGLDNQTSSNLRRLSVGAISKVPKGSDTDAYARAISNVLSRILSTSGKLSDDTVNQIGPQLASGLLKGVSKIAPQIGVDLSGINLQSDLSNIANNYQSPSLDAPVQLFVGGFDSDLAFPGASSASTSTGETLPAVKTSVNTLLNSPLGLKSPQASARINTLSSSLLKAFSPNGLDVNSFADGLKATLSQLTNSGLSKGDATVEGLMESLVALVQILNSAQVSRVDASTTSSTSNALASALSSLLEKY